MATTFAALAAKADWSAPVADDLASQEPTPDKEVEAPTAAPRQSHESGVSLHHDVHVHLPPTSDVAVYRAIFRALREELL